MKARITIGRWTFEVEGKSTRELFEQMSSISDVFDVEIRCGICGKPDLRYQHRALEDDNEFWELKCKNRDCGATLGFGKRKKDSDQLFPRRKNLKTDEYYPNNGWFVYKPEKETANV